MKQIDIVEIVWFDAQSSTEEISLDNIKNVSSVRNNIKPRLSKSIGYVLMDEHEYILIAFMRCGHDIFKHWQVIPKALIKSKTLVRSDG